MDLVWQNNGPQCRIGLLLVVLTVLLGLCDRAKSQISGERIGCTEANETRTCLDIYNSSVTWTDAWSLCLTNNAKLVLIATPEMDEFVGQYMDRITGNFEEDYPVWIAGRELNDPDWKWTNEEAFRAQNTSSMVTLFSAQANRYETCAAVGGGQPGSVLVFEDKQCKDQLQFICQGKYIAPESNTNPTTTCEIAGKKGTMFNNSCYAVISFDLLSWFDARYECQKLGADLAVFNESSTSELREILSLLPNDTTKLFWIGLRKNPWIWVMDYDLDANAVVGRQEISYAGWVTDFPYQRARSCLAMEGRMGVSHGWINLKCDELHPYICYQTTNLMTTAPPTTASPLTTAFYYDEFGNATTAIPEQSSKAKGLVNILVPVFVVTVIIIVVGFTIYCYFSRRSAGYVQHQ